jgi:tRNA threonylcarbamoyladenosine biosynthesis protein TsaB
VLLLALETSSAQGSVSIHRDGKSICSRVWTRVQSHSEMVTVAISECLEQAGLEPGQIDTLAVGRGPGSFTGIRVAINAIKIFSYVSDLPIFAFDSTEILANAVPARGLPVLAMVNAQRSAVFSAQFQYDGDWKKTQDLGLTLLPDLEEKTVLPHICVGDGYPAIESLLTPRLKSLLIRDPALHDSPSSDVLGRLAWSRRNEVPTIDWNELQALYIRASGAEETLRRG